MNTVFANSASAGVVISLLGYGAGIALKKRFRLGIFNPLLISVLLVMLALTVFHIDYDSYYSSARELSWLLTPATVSLAIPLYAQLETLKNNLRAIIGGVLAGSLSSMGSVLLLAKLFGLSHAEYVTLLPKSITTAIGMGVSEELGGYVTISVAVIIVTGILGNMSASFICSLFRITDPVAKGLAIGTSSHAIGTARAMELGETEGAMSGLAIVVSGLITVVFASVFASLL